MIWNFGLLHVLYNTYSIKIRVGNTKHETSCFVYIDTNTRTPSRNTKQTRKSRNKTNTKNWKFTFNPRFLKSYHSPLLSRLSPIHFEKLSIVSSNSISCYKFNLIIYYIVSNRIYIILSNFLFDFQNAKLAKFSVQKH